MARHFRMKLALAVLMSGAFTAAADAATLFKGGAAVLTRSPATGACAATYSPGQILLMEYLPNFATPAAAETMLIVGTDSALLLTSTDVLSKKLLGPGTASVQSFAFGAAKPTLNNVVTVMTSTPTAIGSGTTSLTIAGSVASFGIAGCIITFAGALAKVPGSF